MDAMRRATRQRGRRAGGFTLLEIMITLTVVAIGLMAMMMMQVQAMKDGSRGRHRTGAAMIARDQIERIQNMPFSDSSLDVMNPLTWTTPPWLANGSDATLVARATSSTTSRTWSAPTIRAIPIRTCGVSTSR